MVGRIGSYPDLPSLSNLHGEMGLRLMKLKNSNRCLQNRGCLINNSDSLNYAWRQVDTLWENGNVKSTCRTDQYGGICPKACS